MNKAEFQIAENVETVGNEQIASKGGDTTANQQKHQA